MRVDPSYYLASITRWKYAPSSEFRNTDIGCIVHMEIHINVEGPASEGYLQRFAGWHLVDASKENLTQYSKRVCQHVSNLL